MLHAPVPSSKRSAPLLPGSESPRSFPARGPRRQGRGARRVPRERVLETLEQLQRGRRELDARAAGREDARVAAMRIEIWQDLTAEGRRAVLARPALANDATLAAVAAIIERVRNEGDAALLDYGEARPCRARASPSRTSDSRPRDRLSDAQRCRDSRGRCKHRGVSQAAVTSMPLAVDTAPGVRCERVWRPIESVGLQCRRRNAPLPSTRPLMLGVPARLAGCPTRLLCTLPQATAAPTPPWLRGARERRAARVRSAAHRRSQSRLRHRDLPKVDKVFGLRQRLGD